MALEWFCGLILLFIHQKVGQGRQVNKNHKETHSLEHQFTEVVLAAAALILSDIEETPQCLTSIQW